MPVDDNVQIPSLGAEPLAQKLRRYAMALGISIGIMAALGALFILVLALTLPLMEDEGEDEEYEDVAPPVLESAASSRPLKG